MPAAGVEGSTEPTADPARTPGYVRSERITAAFRMGDAGPCRTAGTTEAAKTDGPAVPGGAAVASALGVGIGRQREGVGLSDRVGVHRPGAEPGDDQQGG